VRVSLVDSFSTRRWPDALPQQTSAHEPVLGYPKLGLQTVRVTRSRSDIRSAFRQLLVDARLDSGLTQAELAQRLSRPQSFVSKYERGERRLDVVEFIEIAAELGIQTDEVLKRLAALAAQSIRG